MLSKLSISVNYTKRVWLQSEKETKSMGKSRLEKTMGNQGAAAPPVDTGEPVEAGATMAVWSSEIDLGIEELGVPFMTLLQGLSKAVTAEGSTAKMGEWFINGYAPEKVVEFVPLQFGISRNYGLPDPKDEDTLVQHCWSPTGVEHGIAVTELGPGIPCADCSLKDWQPTDVVKNGRKVNAPPPCKRSLDFLGYSVTHGTLVRVGFRSTGEKAGRQLAMLAKNKGLGQFKVELGSERSQGGRYVYAVPTVTVLEPDPNELGMARDMIGLPSGLED
jgi:hypothetical protein